MSISLLPDGTISNLENVTKTDIDVAYIKTQTKIFNDLINDLHKMMKDKTMEKKIEEWYSEYKKEEK